MGLPHDIDARRYYRVAYQRLEDGKLILQELERPNAAVYISGYAVECILKALLLVSAPVQQRHEMLDSFKGVIGHNLLRLRDELGKRRINMPGSLVRDFSYLCTWSTELRYDPGNGDREDAKKFVRSARAIVDWADQRMTSWRK